MDGGLAVAIPIQKSMADGNHRHVLILTQPKGYRKKSSNINRLIRWRYRSYEGLCQGITTRHIRYNETMGLIDRLEEKKEVFVIRPDRSLMIGRAERRKDKLYAAYDQGYADGKICYADLCSYLEK